MTGTSDRCPADRCFSGRDIFDRCLFDRVRRVAVAAAGLAHVATRRSSTGSASICTPTSGASRDVLGWANWSCFRTDDGAKSWSVKISRLTGNKPVTRNPEIALSSVATFS